MSWDLATARPTVLGPGGDLDPRLYRNQRGLSVRGRCYWSRPVALIDVDGARGFWHKPHRPANHAGVLWEFPGRKRRGLRNHHGKAAADRDTRCKGKN